MNPAARSFPFIEKALEERRSSRRLRSLRAVTPRSGAEVEVGGRIMINFSSNDYLGLSKHPLLKERAREFTSRYGTGSTASRLICGTCRCTEIVEEKLAFLKGTEAALILNSGFQANLSLLPALADRNSLILSDRLNHRSVIEGAKLARCRTIVYDHNDVQQVRKILEKIRGSGGYSRVIIITESVFSMDGDRGDIDALADLALRFEALFIVDEAHATGVLGENGMGLACGGKADLAVGTFGKALGSFGACFALSKAMCDYMINCCSGFIYSTALPPPVLGAIDAALDLIPTMEKERRMLQERADYLRNALVKLGWNTGDSTTHIVPVIAGSEEAVLELSRELEERGILAVAVRPPTVAKGESRIRLALSLLHNDDHIERLIAAFRRGPKECTP
ncbi:MAG: 8-amino-7-oxononanoate synthase [Syntrophales bacterium]|jgi:8-amino-7-oxononanoate synthase|nr:8-amino-7-oxononanoate synthase [Syntrophales bacterium]MDY0044716.1 8-amino-7-oxononanoate synthase [Syntrophales bacterium]